MTRPTDPREWDERYDHGPDACTECGDQVTDDEAHTPHDDGCDRQGCTCSNVVHPGCCWECVR